MNKKKKWKKIWKNIFRNEKKLWMEKDENFPIFGEK